MGVSWNTELEKSHGGQAAIVKHSGAHLLDMTVYKHLIYVPAGDTLNQNLWNGDKQNCWLHPLVPPSVGTS